jgi:transposase
VFGVIQLGSDLRILIASNPVDFRKGINGPAALVSTTLGTSPYLGEICSTQNSLWLLRSKRNQRKNL